MMGETKTMHFTYEPITLTKMLLQMYAEKFLEKEKEVRATIFAVYKYLDTVTEEEVESLLMEFATNEKLEVITFDDWKHDCKCIFDCIFKTTRFKKLEFEYKKRGYSITGLGVVDKSDSTFYDCVFAEHWQTIQKIFEEKYPVLYEAFIEMTYGHKEVKEHKGITREYLDSFILENFELIGGRNSLDSYI